MTFKNRVCGNFRDGNVCAEIFVMIIPKEAEATAAEEEEEKEEAEAEEAKRRKKYES